MTTFLESIAYGLFLTSAPTSKFGIDGPPRRGEFMPPVSLSRRMFAGSGIRFLHLLNITEEVTRVSHISAVERRRGKTGELVFVRVAIIFSQAGATCIEEEQTIVYRSASARVAPVAHVPRTLLEADEVFQEWTLTTIELFRYSSATFNSHPIHYDGPYAMEQEGYTGLVVDGRAERADGVTAMSATAVCS